MIPVDLAPRRMRVLSLTIGAIVGGGAFAQQFADPQVYCTLAGNPCQYREPPSECQIAYCTFSHPLQLDIADVIDDDDFPEVAVINQVAPAGSITLFRNLGVNATIPTQLALAAVYPILVEPTGGPADIQFADMDGDTFLDMVVTYNCDNVSALDCVVTLYNDGTGDFDNRPQTAVNLSSNKQADGLVVRDLDGDGDPDIAVAGALSFQFGTPREPCVEVLLQAAGQPDGYHHTLVRIDAPGVIRFGNGTEMLSGIFCPPQIGGRLDLAMAMNERDFTLGLEAVAILQNLGDTSGDGFTDWSVATVQAKNSKALAIGKFTTGPTKLDLVVTEELGHKAWTMKQDSCTDYQDPLFRLLGVGQFPYGVAVGHINTDNKDDLIVACADATSGSGYAHGLLVYLKGLGDGTFQAPKYIRVEKAGCCPKPCIVKLADMNGDGSLDMVTSNNEEGSISLIKNIAYQ